MVRRRRRQQLLDRQPAELDAYWHFNHTTSVAADKNDLYSVALHEILHSLGVGTAESWNDFVSGTDWLGPGVIAEVGSGKGLLHTDQSHLVEATMSAHIVDSQM